MPQGHIMKVSSGKWKYQIGPLKASFLIYKLSNIIDVWQHLEQGCCLGQDTKCTCTCAMLNASLWLMQYPYHQNSNSKGWSSCWYISSRFQGKRLTSIHFSNSLVEPQWWMTLYIVTMDPRPYHHCPPSSLPCKGKRFAQCNHNYERKSKFSFNAKMREYNEIPWERESITKFTK